MHRLLIAGAALAAALALAACGSSSSTSTTSSAAPRTTTTVSVKSVDGVGRVLVDPHGMALYSSNLDTAGKPACDGACTSFWKPLTLAAGTPSAATGAGKATIVARADGTRQVAIDGKPLYTFVQDAPGKVNGDGVSDAFSGRHFTWKAVLAGGKSAAAGSSAGSQSRGGYSVGGGY